MLTCDIEIGYRSSVLPLIANIAYRVGPRAEVGRQEGAVRGRRAANKLLKRSDRKGYVVPNLGGNGSA